MARVSGTNLTKEFKPIVELVSCTSNPVGSLFSIWHGSRHNEKISAELAQQMYDTTDKEYLDENKSVSKQFFDACEEVLKCYPEYATESGKDYRNIVTQIARIVLKANVPASECVLFTFSIDCASVALREQMVRSKFASYWTQTSRTADLEHMDVNRSKAVETFGGDKAVEVYDNAVETIRQAYQVLTKLGVPTEEIRLAPESRVHRVYWIISARSLMPILNKRASWIAQGTLWGVIISQVAKILKEQVSPEFTYFMGKNDDCEISDGRVVRYKYDIEVEDRYYERDPQPCDPLWLAYRNLTMPEHTDIEFYDYLKSIYINLWNDEILEVLGWDANDPTKIGKYDRPRSWFEENGKLDMIEGLK